MHGRAPQADPHRRPSAAVVIPAHDEQRVVAGCLDELLRTAAPGEVEVVVVANACTDDTAGAASRPGVQVIETPVPGKVNAIRLGDAACTAFPRVYLDADVLLDTDALRALVAALTRPGVLACSPRPRYDLSGVGPAARCAHRVHRSLMDGRRGLAGAGAYALGRAGHDRVFPLPPVVSDDGWVHRAFSPAERLVVDDARSVVRPAPTLVAEMRRRARVRRGNRQLDRLGPPSPDESLGLPALAARIRDRSVSPVDALCFLTVLAGDRLLAARASSEETAWAADALRRGSPVDRSVCR